jgi:Ca-activated chloride channel family protein
MRFAYPQMLWLLAVVGMLLALFLVWAWRRKQSLISSFVHHRLLPRLTGDVSRTRQKVRLALLGVATFCALLALARPQWGFEWEEARQRGLDVVVALDVSKSMLAEDVRPNRLVRAKLAALDLARLTRSDRVALVPFAGIAYVQCPLTLDFEAFRQNVDVLDVNLMPQGGTAMARAIGTAQSAFKDAGDNDKVLVILSDGEDHDEGALKAARDAARAGLRFFTVGVGTPEGDLLREPDRDGSLAYLKDPQGNVVQSRLNESLLQQIAREGDGFYLPLRDAGAIETLYEQGLAHLSRSDQATRLIRRFNERFHWPLGVAAALLLIELFLSERVRTSRRPRTPAPVAKLVSKAAAAILVCAALPSLDASSVRALKQYEAGNYDEAQAAYEKLLQRKGDDPRLHFNSGAAAYRRGDYTAAAHAFQEASKAPDLDLQQRAYYNLGDAQFRLGEQVPDNSERRDQWQQAIESFEAALQLNPEDADAEHNLEFVKRRIEETSPPPQSQPQSQDGDSREQEENSPPQPSPGSDSEQKENQQPSDSGQTQDESGSSQPPESPDHPREPPESEDRPPSPESPGEDDSSDTTSADAPNPQTGQEPTGTDSGPMSPQEARQLLDGAKQEERPMIFAPKQEGRSSPGTFKDW